MSATPLKVFCIDKDDSYARNITKVLGVELAPCEQKQYPDGELYIRSCSGTAGNVRGHDIFVVGSFFTDQEESLNDKIVKMAIFCGSIRQASANKITAVIPYLGYARQDQKDKSRAPITTKIIARMLESVGIDHFLFLDVHNLAAIQNAFSTRTNQDHLECKNLFAQWASKELDGVDKLAVMSPDSGGLKRTQKFRDALSYYTGNKDISLLFMDKTRDPVTGNLTATQIIGDIEGRTIIGVDDMFATVSTIVLACETTKNYNCNLFAIMATHSIFCGDANDNLSKIDAKVVVADSVAPWRLSEENYKKIEIVHTHQLVADAIKRIHSGTGSISSLLEYRSAE